MLLSEHIQQAQRLLAEHGDGEMMDDDFYRVRRIEAHATTVGQASDWDTKEGEIHFIVVREQ